MELDSYRQLQQDGKLQPAVREGVVAAHAELPASGAARRGGTSRNCLGMGYSSSNVT